MGEFFRRLFSSDYVPHGHCFFWQPSLVWLHVISDLLIAAAYFSIPITLYHVIRKRPDVKLRGIILMFAGFILACGMTHLLAVWDIWNSAYRLEGLAKGITAALSVVSAMLAIRLGPIVVKMASPEQLEAINERLRVEIEARDKAEQKLREYVQVAVLASEDKLHSFLEAASQGILGVASDGGITLLNRRTEEMFGYTRGELLGQRLETLLPDRFRAGHVNHRDRYFAEPRMRSMGEGRDLAGRRKDGTEFPIEIGLSYVSTPEGLLAFGMVSDITERKRAANEIERVNDELRRMNTKLAASEQRFRTCLELAPMAIIGITADGSIALVNRCTEQLFGYPREEMLGRPWAMLHSEREKPAYLARLENLLADTPNQITEFGATEEILMRRKNGSEFLLTAGGAKLNLSDGPLAFGVLMDISQSKKAADDLKRANEELRRSNIEIEQFAHVASHDLQEPLRMITSYLQLIERRYPDRLDAAGKEFIGYAVDGAKRMKRLIRDLLEFSRAGTNAVNFGEIDTGEVLDNALENLKIAIDESSTLITVDPMPTLVGDPVLLTQVFQNLVANAIKFQKGTRPCVHISAQRRGAEWIFSIIDNGIGIEPRHLDRIFRIFERLHSVDEYSGSGIGLAITRKIVERHLGKIWVESQPGSGSTFFFSVAAEMVIANAKSTLSLSATR